MKRIPNEEMQDALYNKGDEKKPIKIMFLNVSFETITNLIKRGKRNARKIFNKLTDWLS